MTPSIAYGRGVRVVSALAVMLVCAARLSCVADAAAPISTYAPRRILTVRAYGAAGLSARDMSEARRVTSAILQVSGIDIRWKDCSSGAGVTAVNACRQRLADDEVVMRLADAPEPMPRGSTSLGYTAIDLHGRRSVLSTVYLNRVRIVAARAKVDESLLAGRAMAHELGHLLLGTESHSTVGLMRAVWSDASLRSRSAADWTLSPSEEAEIHEPAATVQVTGGA